MRSLVRSMTRPDIVGTEVMNRVDWLPRMTSWRDFMRL